MVLDKFSFDQNFSNSKQLAPKPAICNALIPPALVPTKKSKVSNIFFPEAISNCLRKTIAAIALTPRHQEKEYILYF
jgi:hypothetical protein